jgi:MFS family permease
MASIALAPAPGAPFLRLLRERPAFRSFTAIRAIEELGSQMLNIAIAWQVYAASHNPMSLAYVGLARFLPSIGMALIAGPASDRLDRRRVIGVSLLVQALCLAALAVVMAATPLSEGAVYPLLMVITAAQAFSYSAMSAMQPQLVSAEEFPRAVAFSSSVFQVCSLAGPAFGGLVYALSGPGVMALVAALYLAALAQARRLEEPRPAAVTAEGSEADILGGFRYIRSNRLLLSLISLDLFAVLLGGATALLPIYAHDILAIGPAGLGCLRCAPGVGAVIVGLFLARRSLSFRAGRMMLACVAGFGLATLVFALSTRFCLSLVALVAAGGFDMVSMVVRQTLVPLLTPESLRGRVNAVHWMFIGASSELGEFESGATAALFGTVSAAALGGLGTLAIVAAWAVLFPQLRRADMLQSVTDGQFTELEDRNACRSQGAPENQTARRAAQ